MKSIKEISTMKFAAGLWLALLSFYAHGAPVYLSCTTSFKGDPPKEFTVTLDEESGKVTHRFANGTAFNADGFFSAAEVSYKQVNCASTCMTQHFTINRVDLSVQSSVVISARNVGESAPIVANGKCSLQKAPERQF